ncbi:MAG: 4-hydroxy-3-methylbut-2-enyl diphosphate reductase, partial [Gemmatimonadota bacterium]|nr:4-hydroxy-3-methylbut-2-enyl diphosphate reductase [Gemmatimonadota bacterium]
IIAQTAGFCKGVRRALNLVLEKSEQKPGPFFTDGPLIHNPQTIEILERRGVKVLDKATLPAQGDTLFIRSHGISPGRRRELQAMGVRLCDATCPDVAKIQGLIRKHSRAGYSVVIAGDKNHAEVTGLAGYAEDKCFVVSEASEVESLPRLVKVCVVAQSTLDPGIYSQVSEAVKERFEEVIVLDTICPSTNRRQEELRALAKAADAVVVVGGKSSANTRRLAEISRNTGIPTFHVETAEEIDETKMRHFRTVALTAGASTPNWILQQVVGKLNEIEHEASPALWKRLKRSARFIVRSNVFVAFASAMLCYANARMMGITLGWLPYSVSFFYIMSIHLLSHLTDQGAFEVTRSQRLSPYRYREKYFMTLMAASAVTAAVLAGIKGFLPLIVMLLLIALGVLYRLDILSFIMPSGKKKFSLRLIPASKDLVMALGWSFVTVFFPLILTGHRIVTPAFFVTFISTFLLVTIRSLFFDIRDIQGDQIVGRETLPTIIGTRGTKILLITLTTMQAMVIITGAATGWLSGFSYPMLLVTAYICFYLYLYQRRVIHQGTAVEVMGDMQFILAGAVALIFL